MLVAHLAESPRGEWVFQSPKGGFLRYDNFRTRIWDRAVEQAALRTFHQLRHTAAAFMIDEGGDALEIKRRMGHEDIRTTLNTYGHLFADREDDLVAALDARRATALGEMIAPSSVQEWARKRSTTLAVTQ
ncbi:MAG TPA: tyrosine-type recombinase/integrase [Actinomycetota bacterium]|nr:tyrosine-type recombinase/integrase [Actinomycetota bacterium]